MLQLLLSQSTKMAKMQLLSVSSLLLLFLFLFLLLFLLLSANY